ncbi:hypothetical protein GCM10007079_27850 [Nocardiopsis terrae]|uniref:ABC-type polysaccharide/polyol phosphate export permease n=1 Tax=Nocardiopsis terrae TaxID=372655 RepID=A0ABR9HF03_9ACTN|nr:ABC transporter permease [Nocardiopsis terrae]MBE1457609.1 ABC-type polysaccharide/polyol phosphate export permease [Nocardiopsis terrae]GHC85206.1 hypothetical protein GCM10007079_27850 [Nocardiopsis terrae]
MSAPTGNSRGTAPAAPDRRPAPLLGSVLADLVRYLATVLILFAIGSLMDFRVGTDPASAIAAAALAIGFGFALSWVMVFLGVLIRDENGVMAITFIAILPLLLGTSMAAPVDTLPGRLRARAGANPAIHAMDAARALLTGTPAGDSLVLTLAWSAGLAAVFAPLAVWAFNRERCPLGPTGPVRSGPAPPYAGSAGPTHLGRPLGPAPAGRPAGRREESS